MKPLPSLFIGFVFMTLLFPVHACTEESDHENGRAIYLKRCEICHGPEGKGDGYALFNPPVADLTSSSVQSKSDKELWKSIHKGVSNTVMGTWRFVLTDEEIDMVLAYIRALHS